MKKIIFVILSIFLTPDAFSQSNENTGNIRSESRSKEGHYNITQVSLLMGKRKLSERNYYEPQNRIQMASSVTMINGRRYNEFWAVGFGFGFEMFEHNLFPLFLDIRHTVRDNDVSPFFALKMGYSLGSFFKKHYDNLYLNYDPFSVNDADFMNHGGIMLHPEMGVKIPLSTKADLLFTVAYRYQRLKTVVTQTFGQRYEWKHKEDMNRLSFGVAIMFR